MLKALEKNQCPLCTATLPFSVGELVVHTETFVKKKDTFIRSHEIVRISGFKCFEKLSEQTHDYICTSINKKNTNKTFPVYEKNLQKYVSPDEVFKNMVNLPAK